MHLSDDITVPTLCGALYSLELSPPSWFCEQLIPNTIGMRGQRGRNGGEEVEDTVGKESSLQMRKLRLMVLLTHKCQFSLF